MCVASLSSQRVVRPAKGYRPASTLRRANAGTDAVNLSVSGTNAGIDGTYRVRRSAERKTGERLVCPHTPVPTFPGLAFVRAKSRWGLG